MNSNDLEPGQVIPTYQVVHEVIEDGDTGEYLVLFTDGTWVKVNADFKWETLN